MMPETQPTPARPPAAPLPAAGLLPSLPAERYRDMVEHMQDGVALLRAESDGDFVFLSMNPAGARITGKNAAEIPGQRLTAAFPGVVDNGLLAVLHTVRAEKRAHLQFIHPYREGERTLWLQSDAVPLADTESSPIRKSCWFSAMPRPAAPPRNRCRSTPRSSRKAARRSWSPMPITASSP